ncbi:hypothetical protein NXV57_05260 [Bacteroides thetaiotaomicron]|nr:hypothetical protein [Bacteroides thetaiotaomicron]
MTIFDAFEKLRDNYQAIMERCRAFDELIYDDAEKAGGKNMQKSVRHLIAK